MSQFNNPAPPICGSLKRFKNKIFITLWQQFIRVKFKRYNIIKYQNVFSLWHTWLKPVTWFQCSTFCPYCQKKQCAHTFFYVKFHTQPCEKFCRLTKMLNLIYMYRVKCFEKIFDILRKHNRIYKMTFVKWKYIFQFIFFFLYNHIICNKVKVNFFLRQFVILAYEYN